MRNIWNHSNRTDINIGAVIAIIILLLVIMWSVYGINNARDINHEQQKVELEDSIRKTVTLCYAIEGSYPPNIDYLIDNYGLIIDTEKYVIHYEIFASNIAPEIEVFDFISKK